MYFQSDAMTVDFRSDETDEERQTTNQKHEIYVKHIDCRFKEIRKFAISSVCATCCIFRA